MARDRFLLLLRVLHVADNDATDVSDPNCDRLHKICACVNAIHACCAAVLFLFTKVGNYFKEIYASFHVS